MNSKQILSNVNVTEVTPDTSAFDKLDLDSFLKEFKRVSRGAQLAKMEYNGANKAQLALKNLGYGAKDVIDKVQESITPEVALGVTAAAGLGIGSKVLYDRYKSKKSVREPQKNEGDMAAISTAGVIYPSKGRYNVIPNSAYILSREDSQRNKVARIVEERAKAKQSQQLQAQVSKNQTASQALKEKIHDPGPGFKAVESSKGAEFLNNPGLGPVPSKGSDFLSNPRLGEPPVRDKGFYDNILKDHGITKEGQIVKRAQEAKKARDLKNLVDRNSKAAENLKAEVHDPGVQIAPSKSELAKKAFKDKELAKEQTRIAKIHDPGYAPPEPIVKASKGKEYLDNPGLGKVASKPETPAVPKPVTEQSDIYSTSARLRAQGVGSPAKDVTKASESVSSATESIKEAPKDIIKDTSIVKKVGDVVSEIDTPVEALGVGLGVGALALGAKALYDSHKKKKKDMSVGNPTIHNSELSPKEKVVTSTAISDRIQEGSALHTMLQKDFGCSKKKGDMGVTKSALKGAAVGAVTGALTGNVPGALVGAVAGAGLGAVGQKAGEGIKTIEDARDRKKAEEIAKSAVLAQHGFSELSDIDNEVATYCYQYREAEDKDLFLSRLKDMIEPEIFEKVQERIKSKDFSENSQFEYLDQLLEGVTKEDLSHPFSQN